MRSSIQKFVKKMSNNSDDKEESDKNRIENDVAGDDLSPKSGGVRKRKKPKDKVRSMNAALASDDDNSLLGILRDSSRQSRTIASPSSDQQASKENSSEKASPAVSDPQTASPPPSKLNETANIAEKTPEVPKMTKAAAKGDADEPSDQPKDVQKPQATSSQPKTNSAKTSGGDEESAEDEEESGEGSSEYESSEYESSEYESSEEGEDEESSEYESTESEEEGSEEEESDDEEVPAPKQKPKAVAPQKSNVKPKETVVEPNTAEAQKVQVPLAKEDPPQNEESDQQQPETVKAPQQEIKSDETAAAEMPPEAPTEVPTGEESDQVEEDAKPREAVTPSKQETKEVPQEAFAEAPIATQDEPNQPADGSDQVQSQAVAVPQQDAKPEETTTDRPKESSEMPSEASSKTPIAPPPAPSSNPDDVRAKALALLKLAGGDEEEESSEEESGEEEESSEEEEESSEYESTESEEEGSEEEDSDDEDEDAPESEQTQQVVSTTISETKVDETAVVEPMTAEVPSVQAPVAKKDLPGGGDSGQQKPLTAPIEQETKPNDTTEAAEGAKETDEVPPQAPTELPVIENVEADHKSQQLPASPPHQETKPEEPTADGSGETTALAGEASAEAVTPNENEDEGEQQEVDTKQVQQPSETKIYETATDEHNEIIEVPSDASAEVPIANGEEVGRPDDYSDQQEPQAISAPQQETKQEESTVTTGRDKETADLPPDETETDASASVTPQTNEAAEHRLQKASTAGETSNDEKDESMEKLTDDHDDRGEGSKEEAVPETPQEESHIAGAPSAPFAINEKLEVVSVDSDVAISPQHRSDRKEATQHQDDIRNWLPQKLGKSNKEKQDNMKQDYDASSSDSEMAEKAEEENIKTALSEGTPDSEDMYTASDHSEVNENDSDSSEEEETSEDEESEEEPNVEAARAKLRQGENQANLSIPANVESIEIAAEADSIPASAFENCQQLKYVTFPPDSQVQSIGEGAFFKCESLMEMHFPQHLEIIANEAFLGCVELRKVRFSSPETLQQIERYAFFGCKQLLEIGLPEDFDRIGRNAFYGCFKLNPYPKTADPKIFIYTGEDDGELDVPEDVTHVRIESVCEVIPKKTFMYRHQLIQVDFRNAENLKSIEKHAFYRCDNLRDVNLSSTPLQSIGQKAFFGCKSLTSISPPKSLTLVDGDALNFSGYYMYRGDADEMVPPDMKQVRVGSTVRSLQKEAFVQCEKLQEVKLTDAIQLTSIGEEAFYYSESLTEISLPDNLRIIERAAFLGCSSLAKVSLNANLEMIGDEAFEACTALRMIALTENVQVIGDSAFYACAKLKTVRVNDLLKVIGEEAFMLCKTLANITLPSGLGSLGENAFDQCPNLEWIDLSGPDNLPLAMHVRVQYEDEAGERLKMASLVRMYAEMPIDTSKLISDNEEEVQLLEEIKAAYMLIELDRIARIPNQATDNGFVQFLSHHVDDQTAESLAGFLQASNIETVQRLAIAKNISGSSALQVAPPPVLRAFQQRLMFLGRYDLQEETVVRKSDNAIVIEALDYKMEEYYEEGFDRWSLAETLDDELFCRALEDLLLIPLENSFATSNDYFHIVDHKKNGEISKESFLSFCTEQFGRKVVLKFMCHEDQYQRELDRNALDLDRRYVLRMLRHHDKRDTPGMAEALPGFIGAHLSDRESPSDYCHLIVLPRGDRNLEAIYRYEKPDAVEIKSLLREVGKALSHLHDNGLVHGNLRMSKIIRQNGHLKLADMASSALIGLEPLGLKVSSGVLPPEMIHGIFSSSGCEQLEQYYQNANSITQESRAPRISYMPTQMWCAVRAFLTDKNGKGGSFAPRSEGLPYELISASAAADVWAFGALIYACCTGHSLFKVDYRDSIEDGNSLRVLWDWNDLDLEASLAETVGDEATKDILRSILQRDESVRPSMKEALRHPFFDPDTRIQDWQSASTAPSATPHHDYVTILNDELETPQIRNKRSVSSSRLKSALKVPNNMQGEESISLVEYNELSQEVENLKGPVKKSMVTASKSDDDSVTVSEYNKLSDEVALLKKELMKSRQQISIEQEPKEPNQIPVAPNQIAFHDVAVVCKGWLQKRRVDKRSLWKNRYFVSYEDGTITYYRNAAQLNDPTKGGCAFHLVRFQKPDEDSPDTFELQTLQGEPIMQVRLSPLTVSTVEDWLGAKQREDNSVVHKGWLQKQSRKYNQLWNDRYFLVSKMGSVVYYASATDANNPSVGGATFPRVKWEHVADTTKKEDFDLKTVKGELIMKLRLSKLSSSSIDDWMKGNEWYENPNLASSPTSNENVVNDFELVSRSEAPNDIVYENEVATFSGISEMGHTYDEIRLSGNIAVPQEVDAMEAIHEKKENVEEEGNERKIVSEIEDSLPDDYEGEPENASNLSLDGTHEHKRSSGAALDDRQIVDEIRDELPDEDGGMFMDAENVSSLSSEKQKQEDEPQAKGEELGDEHIADDLGDALPDEEETGIKENSNDASLVLKQAGAEGEPIETKGSAGEEVGDRQIIDELGDALPDEEVNESKVHPNDSIPLKDSNNNGVKKPTEVEEVNEKTSDPAKVVHKNHELNVDQNEDDKAIESGGKIAGALQALQEKDDSPSSEEVTKSNVLSVEDAEKKPKDADVIQDVQEKNDGGIANESGENILPAIVKKKEVGDPEKAEKDSGDLTNGNGDKAQPPQEETKDTDNIQETPDENKEITNGISKAFQLFKRKVKREPKEGGDVQQTDNSAPAVDEDRNVSYDYDSIVPERFDGPPKAKPTQTPVSAVNFAGEVSHRSDDEASVDDKPNPDAEVSEDAKPKISAKAKKAAKILGKQTKKLGEQTQKFASQISEKLDLDVKARRRKRREKMKKEKRLRTYSNESLASEGVVKRSSM